MCSSAAYVLEWELVNLLIVVMSTQLYTPTAMAAPQAHPFTAAILEQRDLVPGLLQVFLLPLPSAQTTLRDRLAGGVFAPLVDMQFVSQTL